MPQMTMDETEEVRSPAQLRREFVRSLSKREHELIRSGLELLVCEAKKAKKQVGKVGLDTSEIDELIEELRGDKDTGAGGLIGKFTAQINLFDQGA